MWYIDVIVYTIWIGGNIVHNLDALFKCFLSSLINVSVSHWNMGEYWVYICTYFNISFAEDLEFAATQINEGQRIFHDKAYKQQKKNLTK